MTATFTIETPTTIDEALEILGGGDESVRPVAGGTGLTLLMQYGFFEPTTLVSLRHLVTDFSDIEVVGEGWLRLGALATLRDLERSSTVAERAPLLREALDRLATVRLRNVAQLGGAVAHGHPQMDLPAVLVALRAQIHARSHRGARVIPAEEVFLGYYETTIADDELITHVDIPPFPGQRAAYRKVTARTVDDWPTLGVAVAGRATGGIVDDLGLAIGAIGERPQRLDEVATALRGSPVSAAGLREAAEGAAAGLDLHDGATGSAAYQRRLVAAHVRRALETVLGAEDTGRQR